MSLSLSVVIPTHNRPETLRRLLHNLRDQTRRPTEIIVVNDGEEQPIFDIDDESGLTVPCRMIHRAVPSSAASRNAGLAETSGDVVLFLDDDMVPATDLLARLMEKYEDDPAGVVEAICIPYAEAGWTWKWALWQAFVNATGQMRWGPHRIKSRYVQLPARLVGHVEPTAMMPGGSMSFRRSVVDQVRFDESLHGYAFGEDRELSYRLAPRVALFRTSRLRIPHDPPNGGRSDWVTRGRQYVDNALRVGRVAGGGAGLWTLVAMDLVASIVQHAAWGIAAGNADNLRFAVSAAREMIRRAWAAGRAELCGC